MKLSIVIGAAAALSASACTEYQVADTGEPVPQTALSPYSAWPAELEGHTLEIQTESGWVNAANLAPDGKLTVIPELGTKVVEGTWETRGEALCVNYMPRGEECWPYKSVLASPGKYIYLQSDRGQKLHVRLLNENEEELLQRGG